MPLRSRAWSSAAEAERGELVVRLHLRTIRDSLMRATLHVGGCSAGVALAVRAAMLRVRARDGEPPRGPLDRAISRTLPALGRIGKFGLVALFSRR